MRCGAVRRRDTHGDDVRFSVVLRLTCRGNGAERARREADEAELNVVLTNSRYGLEGDVLWTVATRHRSVVTDT